MVYIYPMYDHVYMYSLALPQKLNVISMILRPSHIVKYISKQWLGITYSLHTTMALNEHNIYLYNTSDLHNVCVLSQPQ